MSKHTALLALALVAALGLASAASATDKTALDKIPVNDLTTTVLADPAFFVTPNQTWDESDSTRG